MSKLCSLPWCRKPIPNKRHCVNFPPDRPTQLAWLDALDAGAWFSIPQETLATGLILCGDHFDTRGNIKRRYEAPDLTPAPVPTATVKIEALGSDEYEEDEAINNDDDDYSPTPPRNSGQRKRSKRIKVNVISRKRSKKEESDEEPNSEDDDDNGEGDDYHQEFISADRSSPTPSPPPRSRSTLTKTGLDSIDSRRLSKLTETAIESAVRPKKGGDGKSAQRKSISLIQKMEIIRMIDSGMKQAQIATKLSLRRSTVWSTVARREKIEQAYSDGAPLRKRVRKGAFDDINQALYAWYQKIKSQNLFVNTRVLLTMAENIALELGRTDFKSSQGWLDKFKQRYNIRFSNAPVKPRKIVTKRKVKQTEADFEEFVQEGENEDSPQVEEIPESDVKCSRSMQSDEVVKQDWLQRMWSHSRIKDYKTNEAYQDKDIFFAEELGFLYRITPKQACQFKYNSQELEFSIVEERVTALMCCNSDGSEKRKLLLTGKYEPGMPSNLPADYKVTKDPSNWITKSIFMNWLRQWDASLKSENRQIVLLLSASSLHTVTPEDVPNIKIVNIPVQALTQLHPINYGIRFSFRARYRRLLLQKLINAQKSHNDPISCSDSVYLLSTAWNELPANVIKDAFVATGYIGGESKTENLPRTDEIDCSSLLSKAAELGLAAPQSKYSFFDYVGIDDSLCAVDCTMSQGKGTNESNIGNITSETAYFNYDEEQQDNDSQIEYTQVRSNLTMTDAQNHLSSLRTWAMSRRTCPQEVHNALSTLESFILGHNS